jgi:hypothetical protein
MLDALLLPIFAAATCENRKTNLLIWVTVSIHRFASIYTETEKIILIIHCKLSNKF